MIIKYENNQLLVDNTVINIAYNVLISSRLKNTIMITESFSESNIEDALYIKLNEVDWANSVGVTQTTNINNFAKEILGFSASAGNGSGSTTNIPDPIPKLTETETNNVTRSQAEINKVNEVKQAIELTENNNATRHTTELSEYIAIKEALLKQAYIRQFNVSSFFSGNSIDVTVTLNGVPKTVTSIFTDITDLNTKLSTSVKNATFKSISATTLQIETFETVDVNLLKIGTTNVTATVTNTENRKSLECIFDKLTDKSNQTELISKLDEIKQVLGDANTLRTTELSIIRGYDSANNTPILKQTVITKTIVGSIVTQTFGTPTFVTDDASQTSYTLTGNFTPDLVQDNYVTSVQRRRYSGILKTYKDISGADVTVIQDNIILLYTTFKNDVLFSIKYFALIDGVAKELVFVTPAIRGVFDSQLKDSLTTPNYFETARFHILDNTPGPTLGKVKRTVIQYYNEENRTRYKNVDGTTNTFFDNPLGANEVAVNINNYVTETFYNTNSSKTLNSQTYNVLSVSVNPTVKPDGSVIAGEVEVYYNDDTSPKFTLTSENPILTFPTTGFDKNIISRQFIKLQPKVDVSYNYEVALPSNIITGDPNIQINKYWFDSNLAEVNTSNEVTLLSLPTAYDNGVNITNVVNTNPVKLNIDANNIKSIARVSNSTLGYAQLTLNAPIKSYEEFIEVSCFKANIQSVVNSSLRVLTFFRNNGFIIKSSSNSNQIRWEQSEGTINSDPTSFVLIDISDFGFNTNELTGIKGVMFMQRVSYTDNTKQNKKFELYIYNEANSTGKLVGTVIRPVSDTGVSSGLNNVLIEFQEQIFATTDSLTEEARIVTIAKNKIGLV